MTNPLKKYGDVRKERIDQLAAMSDGSVAVLGVEGRQVALPQAPSGSGARYGVMDGQSGYFWWSKGRAGTLSWFDADHKEEVMLFMECKEAAR